MSDKPDGGPAFPGATWDGMVSMDPLTNEAKPVLLPAEGMTLRDWFAGRYEPPEEEMLRWARHNGGTNAQARAALRYLEADAMLAEREEGGE